MKQLLSWVCSNWGWICAVLVGVAGLIWLVVFYWKWFSGGESGSTTLRNLVLAFGGIIAIALAAAMWLIVKRRLPRNKPRYRGAVY